MRNSCLLKMVIQHLHHCDREPEITDFGREKIYLAAVPDIISSDCGSLVIWSILGGAEAIPLKADRK